jgi:hypothetical protein
MSEKTTNDLSEAHLSGLFITGAVSAALIVLTYLAELLVVVVKGFPPTTLESWRRSDHCVAAYSRTHTLPK